MSSATDTDTDTTYLGIVHRKNTGSLLLASDSLIFRPDGAGDDHQIIVSWDRVTKHQVSPASHPKALLRVLTGKSDGGNDGVGAAYAFVFPGREDLEKARRDVGTRLSLMRRGRGDEAVAGSRKRPRSSSSEGPSASTSFPSPPSRSTPPSTHYIDLDPIAIIAARSSILASDPSLRAQHRLLVLDSGTLTETDFWDTHSRLVADEYAKISGRAVGGMSSDIKSSLDLGISAFGKSSSSKSSAGSKSKDASGGGGGGDGGSSGGGASSRMSAAGVVHFGVEEMRQIFIMYPAVHLAYEEKVPLELSEEQFWRRYLESEYFHRDRGRMGAHIGRLVNHEESERRRKKGKQGEDNDGARDMSTMKGKTKDEEMKRKEDVAGKEEEAKNRLAAAGTDDIFSRYEKKRVLPTDHLSRTNQRTDHRSTTTSTTQQRLAIGKFDLTATVDVERGSRFLGNDLHPHPGQDTAGSRIVDKYNRHWAIVLHPTESMAGVDLKEVAARSAALVTGMEEVVDEDVRVNGGNDNEMRRLVGFANAQAGDADFARGAGDEGCDKDGQLELRLRDVNAYTGTFSPIEKTNGKDGGDANLHLQYAKILASTMRASTEPILKGEMAGRVRGYCHAPTLSKPFPDPKIGRGLLEALTKKMSADSKTEADVQELADTLPEEFKTKLATFFRRASELLRHFFSLRSIFCEDGDSGIGQSESQKQRLSNIVQGMEKLYGEMNAIRTSTSTLESKMFKPIMDQLDWAFKLHREDSSKSKGGFVTVAKGGFVTMAR